MEATLLEHLMTCIDDFNSANSKLLEKFKTLKDKQAPGLEPEVYFSKKGAYQKWKYFLGYIKDLKCFDTITLRKVFHQTAPDSQSLRIYIILSSMSF